jgi:dTDP-4-dehydrorhamnose 3,5-epimerase
MEVNRTAIADVLVIEPKVFGDSRGFFFESYNERALQEAIGESVRFVQDNHSKSGRNVLRGLHYQADQPQGKLVRAIHGAIFDVAVDIRRESPTFGRWVSAEVSAENKRQVWIPPGLAHGFLVLTETAEVLYKVTDYYAPEHERCIIWDDQSLAISWPLVGAPILSPKDAMGMSLSAALAELENVHHH